MHIHTYICKLFGNKRSSGGVVDPWKGKVLRATFRAIFAGPCQFFRNFIRFLPLGGTISVCVRVCTCVREREREREREIKRLCTSACVREREKETEREKKRERLCECVRVCVCVFWVYTYVYVHSILHICMREYSSLSLNFCKRDTFLRIYVRSRVVCICICICIYIHEHVDDICIYIYSRMGKYA